MKKNTTKSLCLLVFCLIFANISAADDTINLSIKQVLSGLDDYLTEGFEDESFDGEPMLVKATEYNEVIVEMTGKPNALSFISVGVTLPDPVKSDDNTRALLAASTILINIFPDSDKLFKWYDETLEEGLKQQETLDKVEKTRAEDEKEVLLSVVRAKAGYRISIEVKAEEGVIHREADITIAVTIDGQETFELGYILNCTVVATLKGNVKPLTFQNDAGNQAVSFIVPPVDIPGRYKNISGKEKAEYSVVNLKKGKGKIDDLESFSPKPGSGMGKFWPPVLIEENEHYWLITKIYGINAEQLAEMQK